jgi:hypothetical protein
MATVTHKAESSGKVDAKKIMSFTYKDVFKALSEAKQGDKFNVKIQKNETSGYWDWVEVEADGKNTGAANESPVRLAAVSRSTYETPEERAKKQVYIVRQSSISAAIELLKASGAPFDTGNIIEKAKDFEKYVFAVDEVEVQ